MKKSDGISYQLQLQRGVNYEGTLFRVQKGDTVRFTLGASLQGQNVNFFTNHPADANKPFVRTEFRQLPFKNPSPFKFDTFDIFTELNIVQAGSFNFHLCVDKDEAKVSEGYIIVEPGLHGIRNSPLPLNGIIMQTYLTKSLGKLTDWKSRLECAHHGGYNVIHLTPIQELGKSQSSYCLKDQLSVNSAFSNNGRPPTLEEVESIVQTVQKEWGMLTITDLVFNHTANESPWLKDHPESAYNLVNSPHLRPAYLLDRIVWHLTLDIAAGKLSDMGIKDTICEGWQIGKIQEYLWRQLDRFRLHEFVMAHVDETTEEFKAFLQKESRNPPPKDLSKLTEMELMLDPDTYRRLKAKVDFRVAAAKFYWMRADGPGRIEAACHEFKIALQVINHRIYHETQEHLRAAIGNVSANADYRFLNPHGPCYRLPVTEDSPVMWTYFLHPDDSVGLDGAEALMDSKRGAFIMAHNGWVMNDDPLHNFANRGSNVYLRRELIPWGDSVKLFYGDSPKANPYLWNHMAQYTELTARIFHGGRLDNCHSTPLHVAQYMMDRARAIRPDFYVIAELFTKQEHIDNIFINKLGITSLVREAMSAGDSHEEGRLVYRYGGIPVGSFEQPQCRPLVPSVARAVFYDITHDNPSMIETRSEFDLLPSGALVLWADCASGSTRGFDEAVPHNIDVVTETRFYGKWGQDVDEKMALISAKASLNRLHEWLSREGFTEVFVDQVSTDVVTVTRHCPRDRRSAILVVHTAFHRPSRESPHTTRPLPIEGDIIEILFEGSTEFTDSRPEHKKDGSVINGITDYKVWHQDHIPVSSSRIVSLSSTHRELLFDHFPPGSAMAVLVTPFKPAQEALVSLNKAASAFGDLQSMLNEMTYEDLNWLIYRCGQEEHVSIQNGGVYHVPGHGDLNYAGLQGVMSLLADIRPHNDLGHPLCDNLRRGDWLAAYLSSRLLKNEGTKKLGSWLLEHFIQPLGKVPHYLKPCYFDLVVSTVYAVAAETSWQQMGVLKASSLTRALAMCSLQVCGVVSNAKLPPHSKLVPKANLRRSSKIGSDAQLSSLAAGFPHFAEGIWRNWGRDTFISVPGLLLCCNRWDEARQLILCYGGCLRHGLIPNLLGTVFGEEFGVSPRYNARDAVWFWLAAIRSFVERAPYGVAILADPVLRFYPRDVEQKVTSGQMEFPNTLDKLMRSAVEMSLQEVIQEALERHAAGDIEFVEWQAGPRLDEHMHPDGFLVSASVDWMTGFPVGGNGRNCGTWMDKMGSSDWASNRGVPATPRDGSAVEIVGLCYYVVEFLERMHSQGHYRFEGVKRSDTNLVSWKEWKTLLEKNFEDRFWIPADTEDPSLRTNRGVYRDSVGSSNKYTDNQFRPNFLIAMVVASELFTPSKAWRALQRVNVELLGPLGIRTLHPADLAYRGYYDNSDDSADYNIAHGFNYHQGPEWLWPVGYYLRAVLKFSKTQESAEQSAAVSHVQAVLGRHHEALLSSHWRSLPELTNANGQHCAHSCMAQAWSAATLMEALSDLLLLSSDTERK